MDKAEIKYEICRKFSSYGLSSKTIPHEVWDKLIENEYQFRLKIEKLKSENERLKPYVELYNQEFYRRVNETTRADKAEQEIEEYQKEINDICNQYMVGSLKQLPKVITKKSLDKIRVRFDRDEHGNRYFAVMVEHLREFLDQMERGDKDV